MASVSTQKAVFYMQTEHMVSDRTYGVTVTIFGANLDTSKHGNNRLIMF